MQKEDKSVNPSWEADVYAHVYGMDAAALPTVPKPESFRSPLAPVPGTVPVAAPILSPEPEKK